MSHWVRIILEDAVSGQENLPEYVRSGLRHLVQIVETSDMWRFRTSELEALADDLATCGCLSELSRLLWRAATSCGFQHFSLFVVSQGRGPVLASRMLTSFNSKWIKCFENKAYQFIDPVISMARIRDGSFLFSDAISFAPTVQAFWQDAERHGVGRHGLCYAASRPDGARVAVNFYSSQSQEKAEENIRLNRHDLEVISQLAIECFCYTSHGPTSDENVLSERELKFLHTLAIADNPKSAFDQVAAFGGNSQIQSAICEKLDVKTIFQALAIASSKQWFDALPYSAEEVVTPVPKLVGGHLED
ncbi:MAG: autoinducer binding domain-containing protein [Pseudomonadota bacterium]